MNQIKINCLRLKRLKGSVQLTIFCIKVENQNQKVKVNFTHRYINIGIPIHYKELERN